MLPLAVALRNIQVGSGPFGDRAANAETTLGATLSELFTATRKWFLTPELATGTALDGIGSVITIALVAIVIAALVRTRNRPIGSRHARSMSPTVIVFIALLFCLVVSAAATPIDTINLRLVSSFLAPGMILVGWSIEGLASLAPPRWRVQTVASAAVIVWLALAGISAVTFAARPYDHGPTIIVEGDTTTAFTQSVQSLPENAIVYSNNPWRLLAASDRGSRLAPLVRGYRSSGTTNDLPELVAAVTRAESCGKPVYLAWYANPGVMEFHSLDALREELEITRVGPGLSSDGRGDDVVFEITTKGIELKPC